MIEKIFDEIKERNVAISFTLLIGMICYLIVKFWDLVVLTGETLLQSIIILIKHGLSMLFIAVLLIVVRYLFRLSNKKMEERIDDYYKPIIYKTHRKNYISAKLIEDYRELNNIYDKTLEVIIENHSDNSIDYMKGYVSLYNDNTRISKIDFEFDNLCEPFNERIFYNFIDHEKEHWDGFDIYIYEVQMDGKIDKNFRIEGVSFIRTNFLILNFNRFYDFRICGIKTRYNLVWLKEKIRDEIVHRVKFLSTIFIVLIAVIVLLFVLIILFDLVDVSVNLFNIWKSYFQEIIDII